MSVLPADIQDRDGTRDLLQRARCRFPFIDRIFADAGYQGPKMAKTIAARDAGPWKSSGAAIFIASWSCQSDGSLEGASRGSAEIDA